MAPYSFGFFGTGEYTEVSAGLGDFELHYFHHHDPGTRYLNGTRRVEITPRAWAVSYTPISLFDRIHIGGILFDRKFPVDKSSHLNFIVDAGLPIGDFRISWVHISNGFGLIINANPGYDSIKIRYSF